MKKKQKRSLVRILIAAALLILLYFLPLTGPVRLIAYLIPYAVVGADIVRKAVLGIVNRQPFDECLLMTIATAGAFVLGAMTDGDYTEAVAVLLFYQIGELFQSIAVGKSRKNISALMDIRPDYANLIAEDGSWEKTDPDEVPAGSHILVLPGEKIPIDGTVVSGKSRLNTAALTGESMPRDVAEGDAVISGCVNETGPLTICTTREFSDSTVSRILQLIEAASSRKSRSEEFITRFARYYTPAVVAGALVLALLPPLVRLAQPGLSPEWEVWIYRALTFLVISCPCALVISIPLSFFAGIGGAGREGILIKGSHYLESASKISTVVFDKTGTLTEGIFAVSGIVPAEGYSEEEVIRLAAAAERYSTHPAAAAIREKAGEYGPDAGGDPPSVSGCEEIAGRGIRAQAEGHNILAGNAALLEESGVDISGIGAEGTVVWLAADGKYAGQIRIADRIRPEAAEALASMKRSGVRRQVILSGDSESAVRAAAESLGISEACGGLLPADKLEQMERIMAETKGVTAFVGDGINDAPVLSRADIGIAMGAMGSDAAIESADIVLMDDDLNKVGKAVRISRKCMAIVAENIVLALGIKGACLILGAMGITDMKAAIFADVGVMIIAVLNAVRALFVRKL